MLIVKAEEKGEKYKEENLKLPQILYLHIITINILV